MDLPSVPLKVQIIQLPNSLILLSIPFFFSVLSLLSVKYIANNREILGLIGYYNAWFKFYKCCISQLSNSETTGKC